MVCDHRFSTQLVATCLAAVMGATGCAREESQPVQAPAKRAAASEVRLGIYAPVRLTADLDELSDNQREMLSLLLQAADMMNELFWSQAYGDPQPLLSSLDDLDTRRFAEINYGPWDRLDGNKPFVDGVTDKPPGANFYPTDMTVAEFESAQLEGKTALYSLVRRDREGALTLIPYHEAYRDQLEKAAVLLRRAAALADDPGFAKYLELRARALVTDDYRPSDLAWMDMKDNQIDLVIGPIETYEDQLFGYRAAYEAYVLIKDLEWSRRLSRFAFLLPQLQRGLPVSEQYKSQIPGTDSDLNAYDVIFYAGDSNAGSKTIAINLPNDEQVQLEKGTRRLQLKNAMRAKFDKILVPISEILIAEEQLPHITFDAFFGNTMFHEVAHGLGIKNTIDGSGTVRAALKEHASTLEEGKADVLGLYMVAELFDQGEFDQGSLMDHYVTFLAGIFRSVRFGASSAHGRANMIRFNFFEKMGAFTKDPSTGRYRVDFDRMREAVDALSAKIITLQGDGDYDGSTLMVEQLGRIRPELQADLDRLAEAGIPVDIVFEQGPTVLGL